MRLTVRKWGNSAALRIPAAMMDAASLKIDGRIDMREENGRIIIEPLRAPHYDLDHLIEGIHPDNLHEEVDYGEAMGQEKSTN